MHTGVRSLGWTPEELKLNFIFKATPYYLRIDDGKGLDVCLCLCYCLYLYCLCLCYGLFLSLCFVPFLMFVPSLIRVCNKKNKTKDKNKNQKTHTYHTHTHNRLKNLSSPLLPPLASPLLSLHIVY